MYAPYLVLALVFALGVLALYVGLIIPPHVEVKAITGRVREEGQSFPERLQVQLNRAGIDMDAHSFLVLCLGLGLGLGLVGYLASTILIGGLVGFVLGVLIPFAYLEARRDKRRLAFQRGLVDAIRILRQGLGERESLERAIVTASERAPALVRGLFRQAHDAYVRGRAESLGEALAREAGRYNEPFLNALVQVIILYEEQGGRLRQTLGMLEGNLERQIRLYRELRARQGRVRFAALVACPAPVLFLFLMARTSPRIRAYYSSFQGLITFLLVTAISALAYHVMDRQGRRALRLLEGVELRGAGRRRE